MSSTLHPGSYEQKTFTPSVHETSSDDSKRRGSEANHPHRQHSGLELDDYFAGPRDMQKHSKLPFFMRIHGSVMPKMILPLSWVGIWATLITCLHHFKHGLGKQPLSHTYCLTDLFASC